MFTFNVDNAINVIHVFALLMGVAGLVILWHAKTFWQLLRTRAIGLWFKGTVMLTLSLMWFISRLV